MGNCIKKPIDGANFKEEYGYTKGTRSKNKSKKRDDTSSLATGEDNVLVSMFMPQMKLVNGDLKVSDTVTEIICVEKSKREALCEDINVSGNLQTTTSKKELDNCKETKEIIAHEPIIHSFKSVPLPAFLSSPIPPPEKTEEIPIQDGKARNICPMPAFILEEKFTPGRNIENFFDKKGRFRKDEPVNTYLARKQIEEGTRKKDSAIETPTDTPTGL